MRSRGVSSRAALLSLSALLALVVPGCKPTPAPTPIEDAGTSPPTDAGMPDAGMPDAGPPPRDAGDSTTPPPPALEVTNPLLSGDYADPSVIQVGEDYWASATSSEWAPQFPLLHSQNLLQWEQVGVVFSRQPDWSEAKYWAPELAVDQGRYYVFYTAQQKRSDHQGPLCVAVATAPAPQGPYTDHGPLVCEALGSIDGALIRDENDKLFLVWKLDGNSREQPTPIWAQPLDVSGSAPKLVGQRTQLIVNDVPWEGNVVEGPHIIKRNGWFYMFYAGAGCCGLNCNYGVGVARSKKLLEGWEKNPLNPIMRNNESFRCPGHGSVVKDSLGRDYLLYHAYRATDTVYVGRQGMLDVIDWGADGWPTLNARRGPGGTVRTRFVPLVEDFSAAGLPFGWQWPNAFAQPSWSLSRGLLTLAPTADRAQNPVGAILARSTFTGTYAAEAVVDATGVTSGTLAGLAAVGDWDNAFGIAVHDGQVEVWRRYLGRQVTLAAVLAPTSANGRLTLRMKARAGHWFQFAVLDTDGSWTDVGGEQDGALKYPNPNENPDPLPALLPPWDRGVRVGLTVGGAQGASARFDSLRIVPE